MTRLPAQAIVHAPFQGNEFHFKNDKVILESHDHERWMNIFSPEFGNHNYRVTKIIGGHHREDFAGIEAGSTDTLNQKILPVSFMIRSGEFRYKGYSVMEPERPGIKVGAVWNKTCIFCHNTEPYLTTLYRELAGPKGQGYQGNFVDLTLPKEKRAKVIVTDSAKLIEAMTKEIQFLKSGITIKNGAVTDVAAEAAKQTRNHFNQSHLLEVGIGCESCHGGGKEHALHPEVSMSLEPQSSFLKIRTPLDSQKNEYQTVQYQHSQAVTRTCARCHQVLFTGYPWTWEGKARSDSLPGGAHINSGEGRDLLLSKCQVTCTDCHNPHADNDSVAIQKLEGIEGNAICLKCHSQFSNPAALESHSHHSPTGEGGVCLNCHMPKKNMSLDSKLNRYHKIASPTDTDKVEKDRPLECALCHQNKPIIELVEKMEAWYGKKYDRNKLELLYGNLNQNSVTPTLTNGKAHEKAVVLYLLTVAAAQNQKKNIPITLISNELTNPYPLVRYYANNALSAIFNSPSPINLYQNNDSIRIAAAQWIKKFEKNKYPE